MRASIRILIFAALSVGPAAPAVAQDAVIDPGPDTPAGTQYQIPVDTARRDAAPQPHAPKRHNGTTLQSENGFGSSSVVPGAAPVAAPKVQRPARVQHRRQSAGASSPARTRTAAPAAAPVTPSATPPASSSSGTGVLVLLLGSVAIAGGVGSAARRRR